MPFQLVSSWDFRDMAEKDGAWGTCKIPKKSLGNLSSLVEKLTIILSPYFFPHLIIFRVMSRKAAFHRKRYLFKLTILDCLSEFCFYMQPQYYISLFFFILYSDRNQKCLGELQINVFHSIPAQHLCMCKCSCSILTVGGSVFISSRA